MEQSEKILIEGVNARDRRAIEAAFLRFYPPLCFFANKIIKDMDASRDLVQEVFVRLFERDEYHFANIFSLQSFLYNSVRNGAVDHLRRNRKLGELNDTHRQDTVTDSEIFNIRIESEIFEKIFEAIEELPAEARRIFRMSYIDHMSVRDISEKLNIAESTVKTQRQRAKKQLRERLSDLYPILVFMFI